MVNGEEIRGESWGWTESGACSSAVFPAVAPEKPHDDPAIWYDAASLSGMGGLHFKNGRLSQVRIWPESPLDDLPLASSSRLTLLGRDITNGFVASIARLETIEKLTLRETSITPRGLRVFSRSILKELTTESNLKLTLGDIERFLIDHPNCEWKDYSE
jgi:hypothetical protein